MRRALLQALGELRQQPQYETEAALAKAAGVSPSTLNRITEDAGGSMDLLERFARLLGRDPEEFLQRDQAPTLSRLGGFEEALAQAKSFADFPDAVWSRVASMRPMAGQTSVDARTLLKAAEYVDAADGQKSGKVRTIPRPPPKRR